MKQRVMMVLCVLFGAALVMMCDTDAVTDMVDGDEAQAAQASFPLFQCPPGARLVETLSDDDDGRYEAGCVEPPSFRLHGPYMAIHDIGRASSQTRRKVRCYWQGSQRWRAESQSALDAAEASGYDCSTCPEGVEDCSSGATAATEEAAADFAE